MKLAVVGGGAAGFFAAIRAREVNTRLEVTVLESAPRPLGKVKISGGGRCNVTHACYEVDRLVEFYPRGGAQLRGVFHRFGPRQVVAWFEQRRVPLKTEADGRIFPVTDDSQTVVDCLLREAERSGVRLETRRPVRACKAAAGRFLLETAGAVVEADFVLLACGSAAAGYRMATALGHSLIPPVPSLFTFNVSDPRLGGMAGVSVAQAGARLEVAGEAAVSAEGPLLITHWGLSGPVVLRLSAWGARLLAASSYRARLVVDFVPQRNQEEIRSALLTQKSRTPRKQCGGEMPLPMPRRLWHRHLEFHTIDPHQPWGEVPSKLLGRLAESLKRSIFEVSGKGVFKEEFVTAGGVPLAEVDLKTMQSRLVPRLYLAGEVLDVDALTGGFNFQNAWSGGWLAGQSIAEAALGMQ